MALSKEEQERYKQRWKNRNTNSGTASNTGSSVATGSTSPGLSESEKKRYTDRWNSRHDLDQTYLDTFFNDADEFLKRVQSDYNKLDYQSATAASSLDYYKSLRQTESDLSARAQKVQSHFNTYKDKMDANKYNELSAYLSNFITPKFSQQFFDARDYYSQWESEDAYNQAVTQQKEYESKKTADLGSLQQEVDSLQAVYDEAESIALKRGMGGGYDVDENLDEQIRNILSKAGNGEYANMSDLEKAIAQKSAYINQAKVIQNGIKLAGVADESSANYDQEFSKYSGYVDGGKMPVIPDYDDIVYGYINGSQDAKEARSMATAWSKLSDPEKDRLNVVQYMTEEEKALYNYYYNKHGYDAAEEYLDSIIDGLNQLHGQEMFKSLEGNRLAELFFGVAAGFDQANTGLQNLFNSDDYIPTSATQYVSGMVREDFDTGFGKGVYDLITTGANMAPSILTSIVVGAINPAAGALAGNALMGASAAGNAYASAINSGYDKGSARFYAASIGASEVLLGQLIGGISKLGGITPALEKALSGIDNGLARFALQYGGQMVSEGIEEGLQEILDPIMKNAILHADESINWSEVAYSALLGALSAGIMEAPGAVVGAVTDAKLNNTAKKQYGEFTGDLIQEGLQSDPTSESYQLAQKFQQQTEQGKEMTGRQIRQLVSANEAQFKVEDYNAAVSTAKEKLTALGESDVDNIASLAAKRATGQKLTKAERSTLAKSQYGAQVAKEISDEAKVVAEATKLSYKPVTERVKEKDIPAVSKTGKTVDTSTGNTIDMGKAKITDIAKDGSVTIETSDGTKVDADSIEFATKDHSYAISAVAAIENMTPESADVLLKAIDFSGDVKAQIAGLDEAYTYGFNKYSVEDMKSGDFASAITDEQMMSAYNMGLLDKDHSINASEARVMRTKAQADAIRANNEAIGKRVESLERGVYHMNGTEIKDFDNAGKDLDDARMGGVVAAKFFKELGIGRRYFFYESYVRDGVVYYRDQYGVEKENAPNGMYITETGDIYIDLNAGNAMDGLTGFTLGHELGHFIKDNSLKQFERLAGIIDKMYSKTNRSLHDRVLAKQRQLSAKKPVSYEYAKEEVICDALSTMITDGTLFEKLEEIKSVDKGLWESIKRFFRDLIDKFRKAYEKLTPDQQDAKDIRALKGMFDELQTAFAEALVEASDNLQAALESVIEADAEPISADEIITDGAVVTDGVGEKYSIRSMQHDIEKKEMFRDLMTYCNWTQKQVTELQNKLEDLVKYMIPYRDILDMNETYGRDGRRFSPYKPNSDPLYKISMDFSTLCSKRLLTQYVIEQLQLRQNRPMSAEEQMAIRDMLNEYRKVEKGLQVACAMCYVEAARLKSPKQIQAWLDDPSTQMRNYFADKNPEFAAYIKKAQGDFKESKGYDRDASKAQMKEQNKKSGSKDVTELNKIRPKLREQYKVSAEEQAIIDRAASLPNSTYLTAANLANLSESDPVIYAAYTGFVRTATRSKSLETDEPYYYGDSRRDNGNGIVVTDSFIEAVNRENGMRFSSWSDWRIQHLLDYITAVIENSVRGAAMHGYTKFPDEVRVLGKTGMMFNMSGVAGSQTGLNEDGSLNFSDTESINVDEAIQLREEFPEFAGMQCIGVGDAHIIALLRSDIIDYVIPYHVSGLNASLRRMADIYGWKDYTSTQHAAIDKSVKLENAVDKEHWHEEPVFSEFFVGYDTGMTGIKAMKASAELYKQMCRDRGLTPKFNQFAEEENYWKLLIDRKMINQKTGNLIQQKAVTPTFDFDVIKSVVAEFVKNYDAGLEARALNHIVENWDSIPQRIKDLKKRGGTNAKKTKKAMDTLANQTVAAQPKDDGVKRSDRYGGISTDADQIAFVKLSERDPNYQKAMEKLEEQNQKLRADVEHLKEMVKLQGTLTHGTMFTPTSVEAAARVLKKSADADCNTKELAALLNDLYRYIANGKDLSWEGVKEHAQPAVDLLMDSKTQRLDPYAEEVLAAMKGNKVYLTEEQKQEVRYIYGSINNFRSAIAGSVTLVADSKSGISLDSWWHEMAGLYPDKFDAGITATDQPGALADLVGELTNSESYDDMERAANIKFVEMDLLRQVYDSYWNVATLHTVADVKQKQIDRLKMDHAERMRALKEAHKDDLQKLRKENREKMRAAAERSADRRDRADLRRKIRKTIMDLDKILNRGNKQRNVKEGMKDLASKALALQAADKAFIDDYSNEDVIRNGFTTTLSDAEAKLAQECAEMLAVIDNAPSGDYDAVQARMEAERKLDQKMSKLKDAFERERKALNSTSATKLIGDLADAYKAMETSTEKYVQGAYQEAVYNYLVSLKENVGGTPVKDMTASQLEYLLQGYKMVLHSIRTANKLFASSKAETIDQVVNRIAADFGTRKIPSNEVAIVAQKLANKIGWNYEKLYYALDRIGSDAFTELYMNLANSENIVMRDVMEAAAFRDKMVKEYGYNTWKVDQKIDKEFLDNTGKKFRLTLGELMALYAYSRREGAYDHIEYGGFMFGKEDLADPNPANTYKLNRKQLKAVTDTLTAEQKAYAEAMQKYLSETMGNKGNEVSMLLYGIKMFGEENYFPIHVYGVFKAQAQESQAKAAAGFQSMSNAGFTHAQNRTAKAPVILEGFNEVWTDHVNEMSRYHGTVPALEDIRKVMNRSFYADNMTDSTAIKQLMVNKYGEAAMRYFDDLYREANSGAITDKLQSTSKKMLSLFRKNSVAYSLSVLVQQPASLVRAYAMIDRKYFGVKGFGAITSGVAKAVSSKWSKAYSNAYNEMLQYAPGVTMAKEIGGFDTATGGSIRSYLLDTGKSLKQKWKTEDALGKGKAVMDLVDDNPIANLPNVADKIAWIEIWNACKRETLATHKGLKANSEEFMQAVGKRFTEVIRATQVYDSIFSKSPMLKSKNLAVQYLVSFMNEPNTVANMAESALRDISRGNRMSGLRKAHVLIHSVIFTGVLKSIIYAMRDDDEDETYIEKYIESLTGSLLDDFNPLNYIPIARDVWSIAQGYDVERADMAIVSDAINALTKVIETAAKNRDGMTEDELIELDKKLTEASWKLVDSLAAVFGIPMKNVRREINALIDHARIASENSGKTTDMSTWDTISEAVIESIPFMSNTKTKGDKIYEAITKGDQVYLDRLKATYKTEDAFHNAVRKALRENDPRIKEAAEAHISGDPSKRVQIAKQIIADIGKEYFDDVVAAINSEISAMTDSDSDSGTSKEKGYYTAADLMAEAANGDWTAVDQIKADIIDTAQKNGKTADEAEEAFEDSVQTNAKKAYMEGNLTDAAANKLLVNYAGKDAADAEERVRYWKFTRDNPSYKHFTEATVNGYYDHAVPAGISLAVYDKYVTGTADLATIYDRNGKELISKRSQVLRVINSLPLTVYQKDALYLAAGYAESKIGEVPWR